MKLLILSLLLAASLSAEVVERDSVFCTPPKKRKCVDAVDTIPAGWDATHTWNNTKANYDTLWCDCDGDTAYWQCEITIHHPNECSWDGTNPNKVITKHNDTVDTIYVRRPDRWRQETKTVWIKRKPVTETVWK